LGNNLDIMIKITKELVGSIKTLRTQVTGKETERERKKERERERKREREREREREDVIYLFINSFI